LPEYDHRKGTKQGDDRAIPEKLLKDSPVGFSIQIISFPAAFHFQTAIREWMTGPIGL
jgi:hypothetical protein